VISDLEKGRRKYVTTAELMVLARALDTTPIALLYPDPYGDVDMLPTVHATASFALQWFSGFVDIPSPAVADDDQEYMRNLRRVQAARRMDDLWGQVAALLKERKGKQGQERSDIMRAIADVKRDIDKLRASDGNN